MNAMNLRRKECFLSTFSTLSAVSEVRLVPKRDEIRQGLAGQVRFAIHYEDGLPIWAIGNRPSSLLFLWTF